MAPIRLHLGQFRLGPLSGTALWADARDRPHAEGSPNRGPITMTARNAARARSITAAADRLRTAAASRAACAPVRDLLGASDVDAAYLVQQTNIQIQIDADGRTVVGRKIGLTSAAVQRQVGVEEPDFGVLLDDMDVSGSGPVPTERLLQPRAEAEIAFVLARDIDHDVEDTAALRSCIEYASAAIEIVDSRIADWDIAITDTIADNASGGLFALGVDRVGLEAIEPRAVTMKMFRNGALASYGDGSACLGDPLEAVLWLARTALRYGDPLRRGQVVLSGALGPLVPVGFGTHLRAELSGLGSVELKFANAEAA